MKTFTKNLLIASFAIATIALSTSGIARADQPAVKSNNGNPGENPNYMNGRQQILEPGDDPVIVTPTKELVGASVRSGRAGLYIGTVDNSDINYQINSAVMTGLKVQLIWYGSWSNVSSTSPSANNYQGFTTKFLTDLNSQPRWTMNGNYYQKISGVPTNVPIAYSFASASIARNTSKYREPLSQSSIYQIAKDFLGNNKSDPSTLYLVLTSSNVSVKGFGTSFCGWHSYNSTSKMKYSFVGDPANVAGCLPQNIGPNYYAADAMVSVLVHEIEETATDPQLNAWYSANGNENADKCAWTWGSGLTTVANGSYTNLALNGVNYLIQQGFKLSGLKASSSTTDTWSGACAIG